MEAMQVAGEAMGDNQSDVVTERCRKYRYGRQQERARGATMKFRMHRRVETFVPVEYAQASFLKRVLCYAANLTGLDHSLRLQVSRYKANHTTDITLYTVINYFPCTSLNIPNREEATVSLGNGCAIVQAVSHRIITMETRVRS